MLIFWPKGALRTSTPLILAMVMLLALVAAGSMIIFLIVRRKKASYLKDNYFEVYESIAAVLQNSTLSIFEQKEVLLDISDLLYKAQENKRTVSSVIENNDIPSFVEKIKLSYGYQNTILFNFLSGIQNFIYVIFIIQMAIFLIRDTDSFFKTTLGLSILPEMFLLSFIILPLARYFFSHQKILWFIASIFGFLSISFGFNSLLRNFGMDISWTQTYFLKEIPFISSWTIAVVLILILVIIWLLKWLIRYRSLKRVRI
jgi:DNA-binding ferritin-like protein (Dps family)